MPEPYKINIVMILIDFKRLILFVTILATSYSCKIKQQQLTVTVEKVFVTDVVPSGSGLAYFNDSIIIVGDDAEFIGRISSDIQYTKSGLYLNASQNRIEKSLKHDLESATLATISQEKYLLAFGSGGISPFRDTLFAVNMQHANKSFKCSLLPVYNAIRNTAGLNEQELNIEGAAIAGENLLLFNRGKNNGIIISLKEFIQFIQSKNSTVLPDIKVVKLSLPVINNFPVGISGACALNDHELLFTASLEETKDFISDGTIKGSYIGLLRINKNSEIELVSLSPLKDASGNVIPDKLESIEVMKAKGRKVNAVAVADNDDGNSKIYYLNIDIP